MKRVILIAFALIIACFVLNYRLFAKGDSVADKANPGAEISRVIIGKSEFSAEVARTAVERAQGLSGRVNLATDSGMLFLMPYKAIHTFWMKDMHFPLDIIWIDDDLVVDISENVPVPTLGENIPRVWPNKKADLVFEVNAGDVERKRVKVGDKVILK